MDERRNEEGDMLEPAIQRRHVANSSYVITTS